MGLCRIIPLGGLGEVGKNMTVYEADGAIVVVDAGLAFPRDEHLGVDLVLPDFSYLREREEMVRAQVGKVRQDEVDAEVLVAREREPGVDDDDGAVGLVHGHVLADLAEAAERDDPADAHLDRGQKAGALET